MYDTKTLRVRSGGRWVATAGGAAAVDQVVVEHDGAQPQPTTPTPQGVEDAFVAYGDGLHYFKGSGSLVSIVRQPFQTTVVIDGPVRSVGRVVKSEAGLPTPQNPSTLVTCDADGKWFKVTSDELNTPFGPPTVVDIFSLDGGDPATVDMSAFYTKAETDAKFIDQQYFTDNAFYGPSVIFKDNAGNLRWRLDGGDALLGLSGWGDPSVPNSPTVPRLYFEVGDDVGGYLAYADDHYTKAETDAAIVAAATGTVDLTAYAKLSDNTQNVVANAVVAKGYTFGDTVSASNPGLVYTDTGEGYGPRLILDTPAGKELIPYQSDFDPLKARLDALESKQAPAGDLSAYALKTDLLGLATDAAVSATYVTKADARIYTTAADVAAFVQTTYATKADTYTKTDCDTKFLTTVDLARFPFRDDVYTKVEVDETFKKYVSATFLTTTFAPNYFTKTQSDARYANSLPIEAILDEVKKMLTGGKALPADVPWTKLVSAGSSTSFPPEAKVLNGIVYLRGEVVKSIGAGYIANVCQLPATIPPPPKEMVIPLACKNTSPAGRYYGYATFQTNRQIGVSSDNALNTVWLDGISYPAYE